MTARVPTPQVDRQFVRIDEGLVHMRTVANEHDSVPVVMLHPSPASSQFLLPVIAAVGANRRVLAPDTLGNGDSAPPAKDTPDIAYYADAVVRFLDALDIERCDVFGVHTGAHIATELGILAPERIRGIVFDGVALLDDDERQLFLAHYAPPQKPDSIGGQFDWAWNYIRDQMIFYPHFKKDAEHIRAGGSLDPNYLHNLTVNLLRNLEHYHKTYHAVFEHPVLERVAKLVQPLAIVTSSVDPLANAVEPLVGAKPDANVVSASDASEAAHIGAVVEALAHVASR